MFNFQTYWVRLVSRVHLDASISRLGLSTFIFHAYCRLVSRVCPDVAITWLRLSTVIAVKSYIANNIIH